MPAIKQYYIMIIQFAAILIVTLLMCACSTISHFDQYAYSQATSIKVDALSLMDSATAPYQQHQSSVANVLTSIDKIYEYEKNRPKNGTSEKMWALLKDSTGHLYGGFIRRWQREGTLDAGFIQESKRLIGSSFDQISQLESGKIKPSQVTQ
jgi:hypothetical protein